MPGFEIYIHVPFCAWAKCPYCDFYSVSPAGPELVESYLGALELELARSVEGYPDEMQVDSIYFGGGTPSLLDPDQVWRIYCRIKSLWSISPEVEFTLECNPEGLNLRRAADYLSVGVNRLSVGCQSFDDRLLGLLGRSHSAADCRCALEAAEEAGFERLSVDLIFGGPGSDEKSLLGSVETALAHSVGHLCLYGYHLEEKCPAYGRPDLAPVGEELYRSQYLRVCSKLENAGWRHYEISSWAASEAEFCRHNLAYWSRRPYLGCGPAAHSFRPPGLRTWNPDDLTEYLKHWRQNLRPPRGSERLNKEQVLCEQIMLGLRLAAGVEPALVEKLIGGRLGETPGALEEEGLGGMTGGGRFALSEKGWLVYDEILGRLTAKSQLSAGEKGDHCH